jgi:hypothetical protein
MAGTMARTRWPIPVLLVGALAAGSCRGGCARAPDRTAAAQGRLALFPVEAQVVVGFDCARLRGSPAVTKLAALAGRSQVDEREIQELTRRTGLDPFKDVESIVMAFPEEARRGGELGMVLRADHLDEARLVAYVRDGLQKRGDDLVSTVRGRRTLWSARSDPSVVGFFADARTFVLGAGGWGPRMAELADTARPSDSAATNLPLVHLTERAAEPHAIWGAAIVPPETRRKLAEEPRFRSAAAVMTLVAGIDLVKGLQAVLLADVATARDAQALAAKVHETLRDARRNAQVLMLGLGPYLEGVTAKAVDSTFELRVSLAEPQLDDLLDRIGAALTLARQGRAPGFGR